MEKSAIFMTGSVEINIYYIDPEVLALYAVSLEGDGRDEGKLE